MNNIRIGFIGAGKVGVTLGAYFKNKGFCIVGYISRSLQSSQAAAEITSTQAFSDVRQFVEECDMIFITTPDDQIIKVWKELQQCNINNRIICHTSGSLSSTIFDEIETYGAYGYSIHPMYAFSEISGKITGLDSAYFTVEGNNERTDEVVGFIDKLGNKSLLIDSSKKKLYHLANVLVSNLVLALLSMGDDCMQMCGVSAENAIQALMPLIFANIDNVAKKGCVCSLTGPIERNDIGTIIKHLDVLPQQYSGIYAQLSMILTNLAQQKHPQRDYTMLLKCLSDYFNNCYEVKEKLI